MPLLGRLSTTISTKGQVILPKVVRDRWRWGTGTRLTVEDSRRRPSQARPRVPADPAG
jgi:AbrB family looped-hinge helix DNA binding protein